MSKNKLKFADTIYNQLISAITDATEEVTEELLDRSMRIVPVDSGDLQASGKARVFVEGFEVSGQVWYDTSYAEEQHENLEYWHVLGRRAKYLEEPFEEMVDTFGEAISKAIKSVL